eukprot:g27520.t1
MTRASIMEEHRFPNSALAQRRAEHREYQEALETTQRALELLERAKDEYDVVHHFVRPLTAQKRCSYVELIADGPQPAQWFVSHWWGEPVLQFTACVEKHAAHRGLAEKAAAYWVCAYANNQECNRFVVGIYWLWITSAGTLSIVDAEARVYSRIWCDYEVYVTLEKAKSRSHLYDIYTFQEGQAIGITDGVAKIDQKGASWWWEDRKYQREKNFPLLLAKEAMKIQVQHGEATVASDRQRILNAIVGAKEQDAEPPLEHSHYDAVNATLHARFALATWKLTLEHGLSVEHYARVLAASHLTRMSLSFRSRRYVTDEMLKTLASAMPKTLKELSLVMTSCPGISDALVLKDLPLERLHLDLAKNEQLSDGGVEVLCSQLPRGLRHLWFSIGLH